MNAQILEFLQADRHAILATNGVNHTPQLTPVWYLFEDGLLFVSVQIGTVKVHNLRRDPSLSVCIDGGRQDARYVVLYGQAELIEQGSRQEALRRQIIDHYYADQTSADRYYESLKNSPGVIIILKPQRIVSSGFSE